ncbi:hypothetical protein Syun_010355 [Stephania yunnanensis]|uniref:Uncharacterized protein n=1 Tax=Stephania yunnanensis TaxID=152371 RepID=A0AAP0KG99_9MAGN
MEINEDQEIVRKFANFHPSVWKDYFLEYNCDIEALQACTKGVEKLKEVVRNLLKDVQNEPSTQLNLIDALQRLGISYHFEIEIEEAMKHMHDQEIILSFLHDNDLHDLALCFRLLRNQGYKISSDIFREFKDEKGDFKSSLIDDLKGMLSLYEAAHIRIHGEDVLEKALNFTTTNLTSMMTSSPSLSRSPLGRQIQHSLEQPIHKGVPRLEARRYISLYQVNDATWSDTVRTLAKLDFKLVQTLHRQELSDLSRWWKDLDFGKELPFARDKLVECYFWAVGAYFEPTYSIARVFLSKVITLTTIIDDTFDVYGTQEELLLFTDAIQRWDASSIDQLLGQTYKLLYRAILRVYQEMKEMMNKEGCSYQLDYAKEAMKDLVRAYFVEAKWDHEGYVPKLEEYLSNAVVSSACYMIPTTCLVGMGKIMSKEAFEWLRGVPKPLRASSMIGRLMNDVVSHKFEQMRGDVASAVECYMKEYGASEQEACDEINKMVEEAWKDVNEECFTRNTEIPRPLLMRLVNLTRMLHVIYKHEDSFTHSKTRLKENVALLFVDPVDP